MFGNPVLTEEQQKAWLAKYAPDLDDPDRGALRRRRVDLDVDVLPGGDPDDTGPGTLGDPLSANNRRWRRRHGGRNGNPRSVGAHCAERLRALRLSIERSYEAIFERLEPEEDRNPLTAAEAAWRGRMDPEAWLFLQWYIYMPKRAEDQDPDFENFKFAGREESLKALADEWGYTVEYIRGLVAEIAEKLRVPLSKWGRGRLPDGGRTRTGKRAEPRLVPPAQELLPGYYRLAPEPATTGRPPKFDVGRVEAALRVADLIATKLHAHTVAALDNGRADVSTARIGVDLFYAGVATLTSGDPEGKLAYQIPPLTECVVMAATLGRGGKALTRLTRAYVARVAGIPDKVLARVALEAGVRPV